MTDSRAVIFERIRAKISSPMTTPDRAYEVRQRLSRHPSGVVPTAPRTRIASVRRFVAKARDSAASVAVVKRGEQGAEIVEWLRQQNLPRRVRIGGDIRLAAIEWPKSAAPEILAGPSDGNDLTGLSHATAGISESGTLVLVSGADNPTTLNFLPENHVVVIEAQDIEKNQEAVWARLRKAFGPGVLPRTINLVTGPSRSADIEQTLILGAHGPMRLHIVVVEE
jgi:L-lactate dehydrogenase complex protein LldG